MVPAKLSKKMILAVLEAVKSTPLRFEVPMVRFWLVGLKVAIWLLGVTVYEPAGSPLKL
jgi:hypothetical protein